MAKSSLPTGLLLDGVYRDHDTGVGHPECPDRYKAITAALEKADLVSRATAIAQQPATDDDVLLCHTKDYLDIAKRDVAAHRGELSTGDTVICPSSLDVALRAVGGVKNAI